ncbi:hypothetical protein D3C79_748230 [compost metagenome]
MRVCQDLPIAPLQQVIEHVLAAAADLGCGHTFGEVLFGIQLAEAADACDRVVEAGAGEAPGADRCTDQCPLAGRRWQPLAEQRQVQPLNPQWFGPASGTRYHTDIRCLQPAFTDLLQGTFAGLEGQSRVLDMDGAHGRPRNSQVGHYRESHGGCAALSWRQLFSG